MKAIVYTRFGPAEVLKDKDRIHSGKPVLIYGASGSFDTAALNSFQFVGAGVSPPPFDKPRTGLKRARTIAD